MATPRTPRTATTRVVTEINRTAILDALRLHGPLSRKQIGTHTGLSPATVERLCSALLSEGLIANDGLDQSSGGRPSYLLKYSGGKQVVVAIDIDDARARGVAIDFGGTTLASDEAPFAAFRSHDAATRRLDATLDLTDRLIAAARRQGYEPRAVGMSVPGIVHKGRVRNTAELGWRDLELESIVTSRTDLPAIVENDANAIAYGEWARGAATGAQSVASFVLGAGVGTGIVNDGHIYRGARSAAGEIGSLFADTSAMSHYFADRGDLETRLGDIAAKIAPDAATIDAAMAATVDAAVSGTGDPALVTAFFDLLAFACGAVATAFDTELVVLGRHLLRAPALVVSELDRRLVGRIPFPPRLAAASLGDDSALIGVGELAIQHARGSIYLA